MSFLFTDEEYEQPLLPLSQHDVVIDLQDEEEEDDDENEKEFTENVYKIATAKRPPYSFYFHMIPFTINHSNGDKEEVWWMPTKHPIARIINAQPKDILDSDRHYGDMVAYEAWIVDEAIEYMKHLCLKHNLPIDEKETSEE